MYALAVLSLIAVVLLVSANREGLAPTNLIKAPPYNQAEKDRIWAMIPEAAKTAFRTGIAGAGAPTGLELETEMKEHVYRAVAGFYTNVYASATTPITQATLDSLPGPRDNPHYRLSQAAAKAYFVDQTAVSTPPATPGASTPPPAGTGPSPNPSTGNQASSGSYNQLRAQFDVKKSEYDALIARLSTSTNPTAEDITRLRNLNREAFALLEQAIRALSTSQVANMKIGRAHV